MLLFNATLAAIATAMFISSSEAPAALALAVWAGMQWRHLAATAAEIAASCACFNGIAALKTFFPLL